MNAERHTMGPWLTMSAARWWGRTAVECDGAETTYEQLDARSTALARALVASGLQPGSRLATITENHVEHIVLFFACAKSGLILAPLNWRLTADELALQLELFEPSLVAVSTLQWSRFSEDPVVNAYRPLRLESLLEDIAPPPGDEELPEVGEDDGLLLIATSGTTGRPKGALLTHANCFWTNVALGLSVPIASDDVVLQLLPQYHVGGWNVQPLLAWRMGATVVLERAFEPSRVLGLIERRGVTTMMGVPTTYLMLANEPTFDDTNLSSLRTVVVGGAAMPHSLADRWRARGVRIAQGYGLTEASPNVCCLTPDDAEGRGDSVGKPYAYVEVDLRDVNDVPVEGAGRGELWVRGPNVFAGYWRNPSATDAVLRDGWLDTGDVAERDPDGFLRISGRSKEMFISGGENVYPAEVERVLTMFDDVAEAAVVGVGDPRWGEVGVAFVVARCGALVDVGALERHCRAHLASFKVPRSFHVVDRLPQSHIGKIDKAALRSSVLATG